MQDLGWRRRWGSCPAARRGARQRAGLTPASASNTLSCLLEMLHSKQLRSIKMLIDSNHGIYRDLLHRHASAKDVGVVEAPTIRRGGVANPLTRDEARRIATNVASCRSYYGFCF
jgi:hypothetical protein